ncbi:alpha/beta fold hydrolase [Clostridium grantii]|uniref:Lysophospholipase, alpha-beta hydrolase superfamily n=1 Tax=Clostridium grantii DSM 8605 TaxID=1121316 RepID=A0A1M5QM17_9CLOT|nr:alpha/beta hydrolase [Clostridium grantii]SHH15155.1 Lysophospholipase, alpha-beta hydrolase superfamily [Clostridium grantii DSM 8605]
MREEKYRIKGIENHSICVVSWKPECNVIKGVVQIVHGMAEHCMRYREFAEFLTQEGFIVYAHDHRGHGLSVSEDEEQGFLHTNDGFMKLVEETHMVTEFIKKNEKNKKIFILGHSMGSFVTRKYIQIYDKEVVGAIISGTGDSQGALGVVGKVIAKSIAGIKGKKYKSKLLDDLSFGSYNNKFKPVRTNMDWLSRDENQVDMYLKDENCGFICSAWTYVDILNGIEMISNKKNIKKTRNELPILFISGEKDPVGNDGKGVRKVYEKYYCEGLQVELKLFPEARHEILNETNKEEVYEYILNWIYKRV